MSRNDLPQTAQEAQCYGWAWLSVRCQGCRHSQDIKFDDIARRVGTARLGAFAARLRCSQCRGQAVDCALGLYELSGGQPRAFRRPVAFDGGATVRAPRE